jgi:hypothetical protein
MDKGRTWGDICKQTIEDVNKMGIKTYACISSIQENEPRLLKTGEFSESSKKKQGCPRC